MKQIYTLAIIIAVFYFPCLAATQTDGFQRQKDSLLNEARRQGNVKAQAFAMTNELMSYYNSNRYGEFETKSDEYLPFMLAHAEGRNFYFYASPVPC